jgi:two-component system response regulator QseB
MRLLIVEDNDRLATLLADRLSVRGFSADSVQSLSSADDALDACSYDLVVLDLGLPDGDGLDWLTDRRSRGDGPPPTLILTARDGLQDRVAGLDSGADDYVSKPFEIEELAARLRVLLRRPGARSAPVLEIGALRLDLAMREAKLNGSPLGLTRRELDLLELLMRRAGTVVSRSLIDETLYSFDEAFTPNAVEAVVSRLRRKLEEAGGAGYLHTVRGVGYLLRTPD